MPVGRRALASWPLELWGWDIDNLAVVIVRIQRSGLSEPDLELTAGEAQGGQSQPRGDERRGAVASVPADGDRDAVQRGRGVRADDGVDAAEDRGRPDPVNVMVEGDLRDLGPDAAPTPGEDAGAHGVGGGPDAVKDGVEEIVGKTTDAVDSIAASAAATTNVQLPGLELRLFVRKGERDERWV